MLSTELEKRLEECLVGKDTLTRVKELLGLHGEVFKEILSDCKNVKSLMEKDRTNLNLIKKANYQWLYVEKILKDKYPNKDIPEDMFRQITISLSVVEEERLLKALDWLNVKKSDHPVFKALRKLVDTVNHEG
jgi:hypothetical protein|nr:MAG TPA: hypothetical protein [Caudoviricetes sp.]